MCVIYHKPANVKVNFNWLDKMWDTNPHGMGYMTNDGGVVTVFKGIMSKQDMYAYVAGMSLDSIDVVFHFRIATSGGVNAVNTQPFGFGQESELTWYGDMALAHNGIVSMPVGDKSDTALLVESLNYQDLKDILKTLKEEAWYTSSSFALMTANAIHRIGDWFEFDGGYTSNMKWDWALRSTSIPHYMEYTDDLASPWNKGGVYY